MPYEVAHEMWFSYPASPRVSVFRREDVIHSGVCMDLSLPTVTNLDRLTSLEDMINKGAENGGLNILCLDGGGVRALSSLLVLKEVMDRVQGLEGLGAQPNPCDYFDVIAGTGTGGVVACMLGRLKLSTNQAIGHYKQLVTEVFSERKWISISGTGTFKAAKLRGAFKAIVQQVTSNPDEPMVEEQSGDDKCKTVVFAMSKHNLNARNPIIFRSYRGRANQAPDCKIWEVLCATMAHPDLFKSIAIGDSIKELFVDAGLGCNNPISHVLSEIKAMYPERHVASIVSIGAGHTRTIQIPKSTWPQRFLPTNVIQAMKAIAEDSEGVAEDMAVRFEETKDVYFRLNIDQGLQNVQLSEWERLDEVAAHARAYMQQSMVKERIEKLVRAIKERRKMVTTAQIDGRIQSTIVEALMVKRCPAPTPVFTGREQKIQQVEGCLVGEVDERRVCVVHGLGGAGKTQLVLKVVERTREKWTRVLYVDASSQAAIESALQCFATTHEIGKTYEDTIKWLESSRDRWLLVFDNADSPRLGVRIREFFPNCDHGSIVITTRLPDMRALASHSGAECNVSSMDSQDALELLIKTARLQNQSLPPDQLSAATALLEDIGWLALAVVHAGAYIGHSGISISKYRQLFLQQQQNMLEEYSKMLIKVDEYRETVYTTWRMCYGLLGPIAQSMLWLIAYLHFDGITETIFQRAAENMTRKTGLAPIELDMTALGFVQELLSNFLDSDGRWNSPRFLQPMNEISSYSLIELDRVNQAYRVHVLVQDWARTVIPHSSDTAIECTTTLLFLSIRQSASAEARTFRRGLGLHLSRILSQRCHPVNPIHAKYFAKVYDEIGQWKDSEGLWVHALDIFKGLLGDKHPETLSTMNCLARAYRRQGRRNEAEELQMQVLNTRKRLVGDEHPDTLTIMHNLASTYHRQGRWDEAEELQLQVLDGRKQLLGDEHADTVATMNGLARTYRRQGRWDDAEKLQMRVLDVRKRLLGDEHPETLITMSCLASTYQDQGRWGEAEKLQVQVREARKKILGEEHPDTLTAMHNLASTYNRLGRWGEAEGLQKQVLGAREQLIGHEHPDTLTAMHNLASTYNCQGRWDEAERLQAQVVVLSKQVLGAQHPSTLQREEALRKMQSKSHPAADQA